jgi:hypothetical protein
MAVLWSVSHATRSVVISAEGVVCLGDMEECVRGIVMPATLSYRKLVDLAGAELALNRESVVALAKYVREHRGTGPTGAMAITVGSDEAERRARLFQALTLADRPVKIFRDRDAARLWLDEQPSPALPAWLEDDAAGEAA